MFTGSGREGEQVFVGDASMLDSFVAPAALGMASTGMQRTTTSKTMARAKSKALAR